MLFNNTSITTNWISVYCMIYSKVTNVVVICILDYLLKCLDILSRVSVHLYIADMSTIFKFMIRSLYVYFLKRRYRIIYWNPQHPVLLSRRILDLSLIFIREGVDYFIDVNSTCYAPMHFAH